MAGVQAARARLLAVLGPVVTAAGYDLEDVDVMSAGRRRVVRVVVDRDGGVTLDDVADVSAAASAALDQTPAMGDGSYVLEVTSPGVDRPLREPRHWRRAAGRLVRVTVAGVGTVSGRVRTADEDGVVLEVAGGEQRYGYDALGPGAVQVEFGRVDEERVQ